MAFNRIGLMISLISLALTGCVTQQTQSNQFLSSLAPGSSTKFISIHGTEVRYRDLSHPPAAQSLSNTTQHNEIAPTQKTTKIKSIPRETLSGSTNWVPEEIKPTQHERLTVSVLKYREVDGLQKPISTVAKDDIVTVNPAQSYAQPKPKRIQLKSSKTQNHYSFTGRGDNQSQLKQRTANSQRIGFWEWLFGKRKPKPQPAAIVKVVPKPDPAIIDQPNDVLFKHAKTDQLADGQFETILTLSEYANTTAVYEVRGTAGYLGETAERIGRERAEFIKNALINAGVSAAKIRIMDYDASFPGLRGVVTLRDSEAI